MAILHCQEFASVPPLRMEMGQICLLFWEGSLGSESSGSKSLRQHLLLALALLLPAKDSQVQM